MKNALDKRPLILMVDDFPENLQVLGNILGTTTYDIEAATDGVRALQLAEKNQPDLILLDIMMPGMDGYEVCRRLKENPDTADIPVIFLTAKTETDDIVEGFKVGAVDYLTKPFNAFELIARVETQIQLRKKDKRLQELNREHRALLHVLCHDLTNSIGAIEVMMGLLKVPPDSEPMKKEIIDAARSGRDLIDMTSHIRALEEQKIRLGPVSLLDAIHEALTLSRPSYEKKMITVETDVDDALCVHAEKASLAHSVIHNLLSNAIKFSPMNTIIQIKAEPAKEGFLCLTIKDEGIGIPEKILEHLYELGKSACRAGTEGEGGTGFGMPLVKKFVEFYGGWMELNSKEAQEDGAEHGTEIRVYLPLAS